VQRSGRFVVCELDDGSGDPAPPLSAEDVDGDKNLRWTDLAVSRSTITGTVSPA